MKPLTSLMDLRGRRALVTGATGHLGRTIASTLAELGAELLLVDRPGSDFDSLIGPLSANWQSSFLPIECDLESETSRIAMIATVRAAGSGLDILINNAAFVGDSQLGGWSVPFGEQSLHTWRRAMEVNLTAPFHLCQGLAPELGGPRGGSIINIASIYGEHAPVWSLYEGTSMGNPAAYGASKGGLIQLTRWLATAMAPRVRVNAISPGGILRGQSGAFVERYSARTPLGRMATEDDFRGAVAYLATDLSRYVTGEIMRVDGGWGIW